MTRAVVLGEALRPAASVLGLAMDADDPEIVLLDLADPRAVTAAAEVDPMVPRVAVADADKAALIGALGRGGFEVLAGPDPAMVGPAVARLAPPAASGATRLVLVTGVAGGCGRTLLAVNVAVRLATRWSVALIDLTGSGAAAWWLRVEASPWSEIESVASELTPDHLGVVASERGRVRVVGGAGAAPSPELGRAAAHAALGLVDIVIADSPSLSDDRTRSLLELADRVLLVSADDPASNARLSAVPTDHWLIASRSRRSELAGRAVMRCLPDDAPAVRSAAEGDGTVGGGLGRAYDDLAELLAIDASE